MEIWNQVVNIVYLDELPLTLCYLNDPVIKIKIILITLQLNIVYIQRLGWVVNMVRLNLEPSLPQTTQIGAIGTRFTVHLRNGRSVGLDNYRSERKRRLPRRQQTRSKRRGRCFREPTKFLCAVCPINYDRGLCSYEKSSLLRTTHDWTFRMVHRSFL